MKTLTNELVDNSSESYLIDYQGEGEILAICFGFYDHAGNNKFDFYNRLKKLEVLSGRKINKLLLRDYKNSWYHYGVPPLGDDVDQTVSAIRKIIAEIKPSQIITIGQSMGGYAALMFGALLGADKVISFGPLSNFASRKLEIMRDYRWIGIARKVEEAPPQPFYNDLAKLLQKSDKTHYEIFYGTNPGAGADRAEAVNYDAAHGQSFYDLANVKLFAVHNSPHAIVEYLRLNKIIDDVLLNRLFGITRQKTRDIAIGAEWVKWLEENIALGCSDRQLIATLVENKIAPEAAESALAAMHAEEELEKILK